MFTGLIEEIGQIIAIDADNALTQVKISAPQLGDGIRAGDSVAVNGCCLTVASRQGTELTFELSAETVARTNLLRLRRDDPVNMERALPVNGRLGGHFVQGHIDCTAVIDSFEENGRLEIAFDREDVPYVAEKGSIAVDGISLTIAEVGNSHFVSWIIPHTRSHTSLKSAKAGDLVNIEFDILAKYVAQLLLPREPLSG